ncbi:hypothetical protein PCL_07272 [Purpureocillium lilacinum]|uniref:Uncharacterized protein n=1 Tax=Purpureocillium lilacinum TaxID=33203 RepID=A0A2U3DSK6_PURLI|nr:hypothetical protein PCL_07272 [Purpureocillium lilacinum]
MNTLTIARRDGAGGPGLGWIFIIVGCVVVTFAVVGLPLTWWLKRRHNSTSQTTPTALLASASTLAGSGMSTSFPAQPASEANCKSSDVVGQPEGTRAEIEQHLPPGRDGWGRVWEERWQDMQCETFEPRPASEETDGGKRMLVTREIQSDGTRRVSETWSRSSWYVLFGRLATTDTITLKRASTLSRDVEVLTGDLYRHQPR